MTSQFSNTVHAPGPGRSGRARLRHRVAATLLLTLSAAALPMAQAQPTGPTAPASATGPGAIHAAAHPGMRHGSAGAGMMSERMLDAIGASDKQKMKVRDLLKAAQDDMRKQHEGDQALHQKMMALLAAPQVDAAAAETLRQQLQARRDEASKRQLQAMLDVGAVLTPEQRQRLADRMKSRHDSLQQRHHARQASEPRS